MRVIFATASPAEADQLAERLVQERMIACANIIPAVRSIYVWQGEVCRDEEVVMLMETTAERTEQAVERIEALHSYDVPKIVVIDPEVCDAEYAAWLRMVISGDA